MERMTRTTRALVVPLSMAMVAGCSLVHSLDYLTNGGSLVDGSADDGAGNGDAQDEPVDAPSTSDAPRAPPERLADADGATGIALSGSSVYFATPGHVFRLPKAGGAPQPVYTFVNGGTPDAIGADETGGAFFAHANTLHYVAATALSATQVSANAVFCAAGLAVQPDAVYVTDNCSTGRVARWQRADAGMDYFGAGGGPTRAGMVVIDGGAYWMSVPDGGVGSVIGATPGGASNTLVADGQLEPRGLARFGETLYWTTRGTPPDYVDGELHAKTPESTASNVSTYARGLHSPRDVVVVGSHAFVACEGSAAGSDGSIVQVSRQGGDPEVMAEGRPRPAAIDADGQYVYWVEQGSADGASHGGVLRVPLPPDP